MDFPLQLIPSAVKNTPVDSPYGSNLEFVYGAEELRNDLFLLLKTIKGRFLQSIELGTLAVPHMLEDVFLESAVRRCCEQIPGLQCDGVMLAGSTIHVRVVYRGGAAQDFSFSLRSFE